MHQLYEPGSTRQIETVVDGETVRGTVQFTGSSRIKVTLDWPPSDLSDESSISFFSRVPPGEPGYLGEYGEKLAMQFLLSLYEKHKKGDRRRQFGGAHLEEVGRVRYLKVNPHHPESDVKIREKASVDASVYVQIEDDAPYALARFFDSGTDEPFLAESAVYEKSIQEYIDGVKADVGFTLHLEAIRQKLLPEMVRCSALLKSYRVSPRQVAFLQEFGRTWRGDDVVLDAHEIDQLIEMGYLTRDRRLGANERIARAPSIARTRKALENFEARGKELQAAQCRAKIRKVESRMDAKTLRITPAGKLLARDLPSQVEF
jgi:hypothetical protein